MNSWSSKEISVALYVLFLVSWLWRKTFQNLELFPGALPIVKWEQQAEGVTHLDDGTTLHCDRGSEQGETLGPLKAVGALAIARESARGSSDVTAFSGVQDEWFVDDGVVVCRPELFDGWLQVFDRELERIGASRGRGENAKSTAKLVRASGAEQAFEGWDTAYVRETCKVLPVNEPTEYLGTVTGGGAEGLRQHFWQAGAYVDAARLRDLCDPETHHAWI